MAIGTYVDNLPVLSTNKKDYIQLINILKKELPIVNLGEAKWFLSIGITQNENGIKLNQTQEIEETYKKVKDLINNRKWATLLEEKVYYNQDEEQTGKLLDKEYQELYRSLAGSLLYVSEWTQPDLGFATSFVCKKLGKATTRDWKHLGRVVKFMYDTRHERLKFTRNAERLWWDTLTVTGQIVKRTKNQSVDTCSLLLGECNKLEERTTNRSSSIIRKCRICGIG